MTDVDAMGEAELISLAHRAGNLRYRVQPHQLESYDAFHRWNVARQTRAHHDWCASVGARFDRMWVDRWSRRTGKTCKWLIIAWETCVRFHAQHGRGAHGMIAIPMQKKIGGVIVPNTRIVFREALELDQGYFPEYRTTGQGEHEHLYIPAVDARIKLVGLDMHPDALRGPFLDFAFFTEAGFVSNLESTYMSEVQPQFQMRPWAWMAMESSEPKEKFHDFNTVFAPDARLRGTFTSMIITDNTSLTPDEIADEVRATGGRDHPICKRELFNESEVDPEEFVCPEFDEAVHVVDPADWPQPTHAFAIACIDPGTTDPLGLVHFYFDWLRQTIVVESAWQKPNASTLEVAVRNRDTERELWGTQHRLPGEIGPMQSIAGACPVPGGMVWEEPQGALTYWDEKSWSLKPNPYSRISDVENRFILDMNRDYHTAIRAADKSPGSADADVQYMRMLFAARPVKIVVLKNGKTDILIHQLRDGRIKFRDDGKMLDWLRSKKLGHLDCFAALKYGVRDVPWNRNPFPPALKDVHAENMQVPAHYRDRAKNAGMMQAPFQGRQAITSFGGGEWRR